MTTTKTFASPTEIGDILSMAGVDTEPLWGPDTDRIIGLNVIRPTDVDYEYVAWDDTYGWTYNSGYTGDGGPDCYLDVARDADAETVAAQILAVLSGEVDTFRPIPN